eukprot:477743-Amphidinium_carterae.1
MRTRLPPLAQAILRNEWRAHFEAVSAATESRVDVLAPAGTAVQDVPYADAELRHWLHTALRCMRDYKAVPRWYPC